MKKCLFKGLIILIIHVCFVQTCLCQIFTPDEQGYISDPAFKSLIKKKGYQLVFAFEPVNNKSKSYQANVVYNNKLATINNKGELIEMQKVQFRQVSESNGSSSGADIAIAGADNNNRVEPKYEQVVVNGKIGTRNRLSKQPGLPTIYDGLIFLQDDYVEIKLNDKIGLAQGNRILIEPSYEFISFTATQKIKTYHVGKNGKQGLLDQNFKISIPIVYDYLQRCYSCNESTNIYLVGNNRKYGVVRVNGTEIIPLKYSGISFLLPGLIMTKAGKNLYGMVDSNGKVLADTIYSSIRRRRDANLIDLTTAIRSKVGLMDLKGNILLKPVYDYIGNFENGFTSIGLNDKQGIIDKGGMVIIEPIYESVIYKKPYYTVKRDGKYGILSSAGKVIVPIDYNSIYPVGNNFYFEKGLDKGLMTADKKVFKQLKYQEIIPSYGALVIKEDEKYGVIDSSGKIIIPVVYESIEQRQSFLRDGTLKAKKGGKSLFIDRYGNEFDQSYLSNNK